MVTINYVRQPYFVLTERMTLPKGTVIFALTGESKCFMDLSCFGSSLLPQRRECSLQRIRVTVWFAIHMMNL